MDLYKLYYFSKSKYGICGSDFENERKMVLINISLILSLSDLMKFNLPLSGEYLEDFALLTMQNNDKYYIDVSSFNDLNKYIDESKSSNLL